MPLTATKVKTAKPKDKSYKLSDGGGLYLRVTPKGGKYWQLKYRYMGKEKVFSIGTVAKKVTLKMARQAREEAKALLEKGLDPSIEKKVAKALKVEEGQNTFRSIALRWQESQLQGGGIGEAPQSNKTKQNISGILNNHLIPYLGDRVMKEITVPELLSVIRRIEAQGSISTAHRSRAIASRIFRFAIAEGGAERDPAADIVNALQVESTTHHASITSPKEIGDLLRAIDGYTGNPTTRAALQLSPLLFVRPGELRMAEWEEFDLDGGLWEIPPEKTKLRRGHIVPLSKQAISVLRELHKITACSSGVKGKKCYLFSLTQKPMSDGTVNKALRSLGYDSKTIVGHGFRTMASTLLHEQGWLSDAVERQMAHVQGGVKGVYNRAEHIELRTKMMQSWSDYLYGLKEGNCSNVVQLHKQAS